MSVWLLDADSQLHTHHGERLSEGDNYRLCKVRGPHSHYVVYLYIAACFWKEPE